LEFFFFLINLHYIQSIIDIYIYLTNKAKKDEEIQSQINNIIPYIEPNKQLKDVDQGRFAEKVNIYIYSYKIFLILINTFIFLIIKYII